MHSDCPATALSLGRADERARISYSATANIQSNRWNQLCKNTFQILALLQNEEGIASHQQACTVAA